MEFRILGPLELVENGRPVEVAGGRQRTLLALLLVHANEVVSRDRLVDGLWGERPPATAAKVLQNAVAQLRRSLGDDVIVTRAPGYVLRVEPDAIDARRFEALLEDGRRTLAAGDAAEAARILREALALWRGRPLEEYAYEPFAEPEIARLEELRLRALEERMEADLALGRHADLVGELERLVAEHPLRERPRAQLMLGLYRSGRQAEALQAYQQGRRLLTEELGLEPGAALQRLEKQILTQDPALEPPPVVQLPPAERGREATAAPVSKRVRRRIALGLAAIALAAVALLPAVLLSRGDDPAPTVVPNSVIKIDPKTYEIVDVFRVGGGPSKPAIVGDYVFVSSDQDKVLSRIDVRSGEVDTFGGLAFPAGVAAGANGTLWVGSLRGNRVAQIDARRYDLLRLIEFPVGSAPWAVAVGGGSLWVSHNGPPAVSRFSARSGELQRRYLHPFLRGGGFSAEVAFGAGAAWTAANGGRSGLLWVDAVGGGSETVEVGEIPYAVAVGLGGVWVADLVHEPAVNVTPEAGRVLRIDPETRKLQDVIPVGKRPSGVATGGGAVWVANGGETTISKIDPRTNEVVDRIPTRYYPESLVYGHGYLWVTLRSRPFTF